MIIMHTNNKDHPQGIERLFPLVGADTRYDYRFGFFTTADAPGCHFRISFNRNSELFASGVEPELIIIIDTKHYTGEEVKGKLEEKRYCFVGRNDYDELKISWLFPIKDKDMYMISEADCITAIEIRKKRFRLDLFTESPDIWSAFFRAGVAECIHWRLGFFLVRTKNRDVDGLFLRPGRRGTAQDVVSLFEGIEILPHRIIKLDKLRYQEIERSRKDEVF